MDKKHPLLMKFVTEAIYVKRKQKHQTEKEMYCTG